MSIYSNKDKYSEEHKTIINELFEYMLDAGEEDKDGASLLIRSKVALVR